MSVLLEFVSTELFAFPGLEDQLQLAQLLLDGMILVMEIKRGRMTGRQAQMRMTAGSVVDQSAKIRTPCVKRFGLARLTARAMLTATPLKEVSELSQLGQGERGWTDIVPRAKTLEMAIFCFLAICRSHVMRMGKIRMVRSIAALRNPIETGELFLNLHTLLFCHIALGRCGAHEVRFKINRAMQYRDTMPMHDHQAIRNHRARRLKTRLYKKRMESLAVVTTKLYMSWLEKESIPGMANAAFDAIPFSVP